MSWAARPFGPFGRLGTFARPPVAHGQRLRPRLCGEAQAAVAKVGATKAAVATVKGAQTAAAYGKSAVKVAAKSQTTKKALGFLKSMKDQIVEAAGVPDDDKK